MKSWKDITLEKAQQLIKLKEIESPDYLEVEVETLSILLDKPISEIEEWTPQTILETFAQYKFLDTMPSKRQDLKIKVGNKWYGLIPFNKYSVAQMIDIEEWVKDGIIENLHKIMSRMYYPMKRNWFGKLETGEYVQSDEIEKAFQQLPMDIVYGNILFFYHIVVLYLNNTKDSLEVKTKEMITKMMEEMKSSHLKKSENLNEKSEQVSGSGSE